MVVLAEKLVEERVPIPVMHERYSSVINMVEALIGVVPNCNPYFEIWPPAFRIFNLIVPNFLDLPNLLFGRGAPKDMVGLALYASARAASCPYCSAHGCAFAMRRNARLEAISGEARTPKEKAVVDFAEALSSDPPSFDQSNLANMRTYFSERDIEAILLGVAMEGFLNKFMDTVGVELEEETIAEVTPVISQSQWAVGKHGWALDADVEPGSKAPKKDGLRRYLSLLPHVRGAGRWDKSFKEGVPDHPAEARKLIAESYQFDEPLIERLPTKRAQIALAAVLKQSLEPTQSAVGTKVKSVAGLVYSRYVDNKHLLTQNWKMARHAKIPDEMIDFILEGKYPESEVEPGLFALLEFASQIAPSPTQIEEQNLEALTEHFRADEIIEIVVWVSVLQLLQRLSLFYAVLDEGGG